MRRIDWIAGLALTALVVSACDRPSDPRAAPAHRGPLTEATPTASHSRSGSPPPAAPAAPAPPLPEPPTVRTAGAARCRVGTPMAVGQLEQGRLRTMGLATGPLANLLVWPGEDDRVAGAFLDRVTLAATPFAVELPAARYLHAVEPLGERFLIMTHHVCPDQKYSYKCLHVRSVAPRDPGGGRSATFTTKEWIREQLLARPNPRELWLLRSHTYLPPALDRFALGADGDFAVTTGTAYQLDGGYANARALATNGGDAFAIFDADHPSGKPVLVGPDGKSRPLHWLAPEAELHGLEWHDGALALLFEHGNLRLARLGPDGRLRGRPTVIPVGAPLPAPFAERLWATTEHAGSQLRLLRRDAAGRLVGELTVISNGFRGSKRDAALAAVAFDGARFLVAFGTYTLAGWGVFVVPVGCAGGAAPVV